MPTRLLDSLECDFPACTCGYFHVYPSCSFVCLCILLRIYAKEATDPSPIAKGVVPFCLLVAWSSSSPCPLQLLRRHSPGFLLPGLLHVPHLELCVAAVLDHAISIFQNTSTHFVKWCRKCWHFCSINTEEGFLCLPRWWRASSERGTAQKMQSR